MLEVWWGSLRDLSKNVLKQGVGKGESCSQGEGVSKVSAPLPPRKILILHSMQPPYNDWKLDHN